MRPTSFLSLLCLAILILQQGCAATPRSPDVPMEVRAHIRTVDITVSEQLPRVTLDLPSKGALSGAGRGAGNWTLNWVSIPQKSSARIDPDVRDFLRTWGWPVALVVGAIQWAGALAGAPVAAVAGALSGAIEAPSASAVEVTETQVRRVLQDERLIGEFGKQVHDYITNQTHLIPTFLPRAGRDDTVDGHTGTGAQPDAKLTIVLKSIGLEGTSDVNPPLALYLEAEYTLIYRPTPHGLSDSPEALLDSQHTAAGAVYRRTFRYVNDGRPNDVHTLAEWTADEASPLRKAVDVSFARMAGYIVNDMLVPHRY